jgi:type VI secretion system protein ImpK
MPLGRLSSRIIREADDVLALVPPLRATGFVSDLARLREKLTGMLLEFQARARAGGIDPSRITQATEVLAALLDHVVTAMPWGADAGWQSLAANSRASSSASAASTASAASSRSALSQSRRAAQRLLEVARASSSDAGMRELIGVALALGFDGRGRGADDLQIEQARALLAASDPKDATRAAHSLSPEWQSTVEGGKALSSWLPLWVSSLVIAALLAVLFFALEISLGSKSDRLYARMAALNGPTTAAPRPLPAPQPRLTRALAQQIRALNMSVRDEIDRSVVVVPDARLFEAGEATLLPASTDLLSAIATALQQTPGRIQVIGHTDGTAARSARYPSDWELSVDRARMVQDALHNLGMDASRLAYDGRASIEPLLAIDRTPAVGGNGRVEIILLVGR